MTLTLSAMPSATDVQKYKNAETKTNEYPRVGGLGEAYKMPVALFRKDPDLRLLAY